MMQLPAQRNCIKTVAWAVAWGRELGAQNDLHVQKMCRLKAIQWQRLSRHCLEHRDSSDGSWG
jgi:hypothetical protein